MILRFAVVVQWVDKKYSIPMSDVLGAIRVKIFETLGTKDAIRFKKAQVRLDNITSETFESIVKKLSTLAKSEGELGKLMWRDAYQTSLKDGIRQRTTMTVTTMKAAKFLVGLNSLDYDLTTESASFGSSILRISSFGDVSFVHLPLFVELVVDVRYGVRTTGLEIGYGIGRIGKAVGTYPRHASGTAYEGFVDGDTSSLGEWETHPIIPPYNSFPAYMRLHVGKSIMEAEATLKSLAIDENPYGRQIHPNILTEARIWSQTPAQDMQDREFWHHPKLTEANCGYATPDHVEAANKAKAEREAERIKQRQDKQEKKKRIEDLKVLMRQYKYWRTDEERRHVYALRAEYTKLTGETALFTVNATS